ncbi:MAG: hypothetical protein RLZZ15_1804 [Verrucomicrobiota bacterium]|jgi:hypothetical protein
MNASFSRDHAERIDRALEGLLPADELAAFHAEVIRDADLRAAYVERAWLHGALRAERDLLPSLLEKSDAAPAPVARWPWLASFGVAATAAAAAAVLTFVWLDFRRAAPTPTLAAASPVATLVQADNTKWAGSTLPTLPQSALGPGMFSLIEGIATVRFASGAVVTLEAPTKLEIVSALRCRLLEGSLTADVPESAHGFTVDTADLRVVDLGTRFGITASATGNTHVFVFTGEVEVDDGGRGPARRVTAGRSFHGDSASTAPSAEPNRAEPPRMIDGWTSVTTAEGRGRDSFVRRGYPEPMGAQPLLMVKHSDLERSRNNERRAILTFDLAELHGAEISEAQIVLDPEPSGMGFAINAAPEARFAIYGVKPGVADGWRENTVAWETLPACDDAGVIAGQTARLAEFTLARGGSGEPVTIRGAGLAAFARSCRGGLATFLIVRETGETDQTGLVHAFASKEHPTARPPTLRVR